MIRRAEWPGKSGTLETLGWDDRHDATVLDQRTAAMVRLGERVAAQSVLIRTGAPKAAIVAAAYAVYEAKRAAIAAAASAET